MKKEKKSKEERNIKYRQIMTVIITALTTIITVCLGVIVHNIFFL